MRRSAPGRQGAAQTAVAGALARGKAVRRVGSGTRSTERPGSGARPWNAGR